MSQWITGVKVTSGYLQGETLNTNLGSLDDMTFTTPPDKTATSLKLIQGNRVLWQGVGLLSLLGTMESGDSILLAGITVKVGEASPYESCEMRYTLTKVGTQTLSLSLVLRCYTDSTTYTDITISTPQTLDGTIYPLTDEFYFFFAFTEYDGESFVCTGLSDSYGNGGDLRTNAWAMNYFDFITLVNGNVDIEDFSPEFGHASEEDGGYNDGFPHGSFDDSSDEIALDTKPTVGVSTAGFVRVYKVTTNDLLNFGEKLFPDPESVAVTERLWFTMAYSKLIDYVIDCHVIPTAITGGTLENLKVGWKTFADISLVRTTTDYVDVDCGTVSIPEYWRNFLDFASCSCEIYLPFIGFVPIESEYWNGGSINLIYRFNVVDGSFQAKLFSTSSKSNLTNSLIGQYGGVCCLHLPITGLQYANVITGILSAGTGVALDVQAGNYGNIPNQLSNVLSLKPDLAMSNSYSATTSFLTHRTPYLVIKRAVAQFSKKYNLENGFPLNVAKPLSSIHGFTIIDNPRLNIDCNDEEYNEICNLLKTGVIF